MFRIFMRTSSFQQFAGRDNFDGSWRDEVAPDPIMMTNDAYGIEVRAVVQGVAVGYRHHIVMICDRRSNRGIDAEISCPTGYKNSVWVDFGQAYPQLGPDKRIVQSRWHDNVGAFPDEFGKKL